MPSAPHEGRRQAVRNLVEAGIDGLVVIGGDGSLTGALVLHEEWQGHLKALAADKAIPAEKATNAQPFRIVGLPGSIDNDLYGTDMSHGADTALNTIVQAVDKLTSTADAHQRTFIVEVMGRRCGYLALMGAVATGRGLGVDPRRRNGCALAYSDGRCAEARPGCRPAPRHHHVRGRRAPQRWPAYPGGDYPGNPRARTGVEARVTVLGHVQRGGSPSAFDRVLGQPAWRGGRGIHGRPGPDAGA